MHVKPPLKSYEPYKHSIFEKKMGLEVDENIIIHMH
jgi:hypothetical protein